MALTQDFRTRIVQRIQNDPDFARELLHEALTLILNGDDTGKLILRDLVNATVGFEKLAVEVHKPSKSLHRMLSSTGNPTFKNLSAILVAVRDALHVQFEAVVLPA
jgi:DNA-binding phage protein